MPPAELLTGRHGARHRLTGVNVSSARTVTTDPPALGATRERSAGA